MPKMAIGFLAAVCTILYLHRNNLASVKLFDVWFNAAAQPNHGYKHALIFLKNWVL